MNITKLIKKAFNKGSDNTAVLIVGNVLALIVYIFYIYSIVTGIYTEGIWTVLKWITAIITGEGIMILTKWLIFFEIGLIMMIKNDV